MKKLKELSPNTIKSYHRDLALYRRLLADGDPRVEWLRKTIKRLETRLGLK